MTTTCKTNCTCDDINKAFKDIMDGQDWTDIRYITGLPDDRCKEIVTIYKNMK